MRASDEPPDMFFHRHRGGRTAEGEVAEVLSGYDVAPGDHPYWSDGAPQSMLIDEVESLWSAIADRNDWQPFEAKILAVRRMGEAHGEPPAGHVGFAKAGPDTN